MFSIRNHKKDKTEVVWGVWNQYPCGVGSGNQSVIVAQMLSTAEKQLYLYAKFKVSFPEDL